MRQQALLLQDQYREVSIEQSLQQAQWQSIQEEKSSISEVASPHLAEFLDFRVVPK